MSQKHWHMLRARRNKLLEETDKTQLADFPLDTKTRSQYKDYRKYLRDLPPMYNDDSVKDFKVKTFQEWLAWRRGGDY
jgi:hypothetical protein